MQVSARSADVRGEDLLRKVGEHWRLARRTIMVDESVLRTLMKSLSHLLHVLQTLRSHQGLKYPISLLTMVPLIQ